MGFWPKKGVFVRANAQVLKWVRQKCAKSCKKFAKVRAFEQKLTGIEPLLITFFALIFRKDYKLGL